MLSTQQGLSKEFQIFINKLKQLDLGSIAYQLMYSEEGKRWNFEQTNRAIHHYSMFLCLIYLHPNRKLVPTQEIDRVWHYHILDTMKYAEDCEILFGRFIHHFPYFGKRGKVDRENLDAAFRDTQILFQEYFEIDLALEEESSQMADCQPVVRAEKMIRPVVNIDMDFFKLVA